MTKDPFEKIRSLVERKKLFTEVVALKSEIICKGSDESLFSFVPQKMMSESLVVGTIKSIERAPAPGEIEVLGNFMAEGERYFLTGPLKIAANEAILNVNSEIFKLQRRQSHRVIIPEDMKIFFTLTSLGNELMFLNAKFHDISVGGARIYFNPFEIAKMAKVPKFVAGTKITGVFHTPSGKSIEVEGELKHVLNLPNGVEHYGLELKTDKAAVKNRLMALVMDIQHKLVVGLP